MTRERSEGQSTRARVEPDYLVTGEARDEDKSSFGSTGPDYETRGQTGEYDALARYNQRLARARRAEMRELERMARSLYRVPGQLEREKQAATGEMRRQAALQLAAQGGRGNVIGAGSATKAVSQEAANIGSRFGDQIRSAATDAAKARVELEQQRIAGMVKPGIDVERVRGELEKIVDRNKRDWVNAWTFGLAGDAAKPTALADELRALEASTEDPLAQAQIRRVRSNLEAGNDPFEGLS